MDWVERDIKDHLVLKFLANLIFFFNRYIFARNINMDKNIKILEYFMKMKV